MFLTGLCGLGHVPKQRADNADELRAFREIATLRHTELAAPEDRPTDLGGGASAARGLGMNRLAERLEAAGALADL